MSASREAVFRDPISYLESQWNQHGIYPGAKFNPQLSDKDNWWNGVSIKPEATPMCDRCQNDTREYARLRAEVSLAQFTEKNMKCSHHCLWFAWFHQQRQKMTSNPVSKK